MRVVFLLLLFLLLLSLSSGMLKAQAPDSIFLLEKADIIQKAEEHFKKEYPEFNANDFDQLTVSKNKKNLYKVIFRQVIEYVPIGKAYHYSAYCILNDSMQVQKSHINSTRSKPGLTVSTFYSKKPADQKAIDFVVKAIKEDNPHFFIQKKGWLYRIYERKQSYEIEMASPSVTIFCTINKITGAIVNCRHKGRPSASEAAMSEEWEEIN